MSHMGKRILLFLSASPHTPKVSLLRLHLEIVPDAVPIRKHAIRALSSSSSMRTKTSIALEVATTAL